MKPISLFTKYLTLLVFMIVSSLAFSQEEEYEVLYEAIGTANISGVQTTVSVPIPATNNGAGFAMSSYKKEELFLRLDMGDHFVNGGHTWSYSINANYTVTSAASTVTNTVALSIGDQVSGTGTPERYIKIFDQDNLYGSVNSYPTSVSLVLSNGNSSGSAFSSSLVNGNNTLRFQVLAKKEIVYETIDGTNPGIGADVIPAPSQMTVQGIYPINSTYGKVKLNWADLHFPQYEVQILKVEPTKNGQLTTDWNRALSIVVKGKTHHEFTPSAGTGYYTWRLRGIGNRYEGGLGNPENYGEWSATQPLTFSGLGFTQPTPNNPYKVSLNTPTQQITSSAQAYRFFYIKQFDNDLNWSYNHVMMEDGREKETMTFANGIGQVKQTQTKLESANKVFASESVYDYSGRAALSTMAAPTGENTIRFDEDFFQNASGTPYSAADFDKNSNLFSPSAVHQNSPLVNYYDDQSEGDFKGHYIPHNQGKVFTRTQFHTDATNRPWRAAGVGEKFQLSDSPDPNINHNVIAEYSSVSQDELDRIFGSEAPLANTVYKVQNTDRNGVKTLSYVAKAGQTIATMLNNDVQLDNLSNVGDSEFGVYEYLDPIVYTPGVDVSSSSKVIMVTGTEQVWPNKPKVATVDLEYKFTPATFGVNCDNSCTDCGFCKDCDYHIEIRIKNQQYPNDADKNATVSFDYTPNPAVDCSTPNSLIDFSDLGSSNRISNLQILEPSGGVSTSPNFASLFSDGEMFLQSGTYTIERTVGIRNTDPATGFEYMQAYLNDLRAVFENEWTKDNNCCGPVVLDSTFNCDTLPNIDCDTDPDASARIDELTDQLFGLVQKEQNTFLGYINQGMITTSYYYHSYLTNPNNNALLSYAYTTKPALRAKIEDMICNKGILSNDLINCYLAYKGMLEVNIENAKLVFNGQAGSVTGPNSPGVEVSESLDVLKGIFNCVGYDYDNSACQHYKMVVFYNGGNSTEEQLAISKATAAANDPLNTFKYYIIHDQLTNISGIGNSGHGTHISNGLAEIVEIQTASVSNPDMKLQGYRNCYEQFKYPSGITGNMSDEEAKAYLANMFCECVKSSDPGANPSPSNPAPDYAATIMPCKDNCVAKATAFEVAINNYVLGVNAKKGVFTPETISPTSTVSIWSDTATWDPLFSQSEIECYKNMMVSQCLKQCEVPITKKIGTPAFMQDMQANGCVTGCTGPVGCQIQAGQYISGSTSTYACLDDFMNSQELKSALKQEQLEFQQAFLYGAEFAPANNTNPYLQIADMDLFQEEAVEFFYSSLNEEYSFRNPQHSITNTTNDYRHSFHPYTQLNTANPVSQRTKKWTVELSTGVNRTIVGVTNIVWDKRGKTNPWDWAVVELNVAFYCENGGNNYGKNRLGGWAYSTMKDEAPSRGFCSLLEPGSLISLDVETQIASFFFDKTGIFHAKPVTSACNISWQNAHYWELILEGDFSAKGSFSINNPASTASNNYILLEYGSLNNSVYIMDSPVQWQAATGGLSAQQATAQAIVDEINATVTTPKFTAERNGSSVTVYVAANHIDPLDNGAPLTKTGGIQTSTSQVNWIDKPLELHMMSCDEGNIDKASCPYGFEKLDKLDPQGNPNVYQGYQLPNDNQALANDVKDFISTELKEIIINPVETPNPKFNPQTEYGFPLGFTGNQVVMNLIQCEKSKVIVIDGHEYELIVSLSGIVRSNYVDLANEWMHTFLHIEMSCKADKSTKLFVLNFGDGKSMINMGNNFAGLGMDKLWGFSDRIGQGVNTLRSTWAASNLGAIPVIFDDITFDTDATGKLNRFIFEFNLLNNVLNHPNFPTYYGTNGAPGSNVTVGGITYITPNFSGIVISHVGYFVNFSPSHNFYASSNVGYRVLTGLGAGVWQTINAGGPMSYTPCPPIATCEMCMRWKKAESNVSPVQIEKLTCEDELQDYYDQQINLALETCYEAKVEELKENYTSCLKNYSDEVSVKFNLNYGQYTLYYYDRAGNLIQTVPPAGVKTVDLTQANRNKLASFRSGNPSQFVDPGHEMKTHYRYNSIKQLKWQKTPDGGVTQFAYNALGQLVLSQDAMQAQSKKFSYSKYDALGRVIEVGQFTSNLSLTNLEKKAWNNSHFPYLSGGTVITGISNLEERVYTEYGNTITPSLTLSASPSLEIQFTNLRNRVYRSYNDEGYESRYSYDQHGNVKLLANYAPHLGWKVLEYEYDLISGNVKNVCYNCVFNNVSDQFRHRYTYDEDNRITKVETSKDGVVWDVDAQYNYYAHGPLERTEIGEDKIQGIDYTYTSEGYLKGINQVELNKRGAKDPGMDGAYVAEFTFPQNTALSSLTVSNDISASFELISGTIPSNTSEVDFATAVVKNINDQYLLNPAAYPYRADNELGTSKQVKVYSAKKSSYVSAPGSQIVYNNFRLNAEFAPDEFAMELGYYDGDFYRTNSFIGGNTQSVNNPAQFALQASSGLSTTANSLYNGNIAYWHTNTAKGQESFTGNDRYDNTLNVYRYDVLNRIKQNDFQYFDKTNNIFLNGENRYDESFEYDGNGNITQLRRHGNSTVGNTSSLLMDNFNYHYHSLSGAKSNRLEYVDDQENWGSAGNDIKPGQTSNNYTYYNNGSLKADNQEQLTFKWNNLKKLKEVRNATNNEVLKFYYDPMGNRIRKETWSNNGANHLSSKHYVRDAQGNVMAIYTETHAPNLHEMTLSEFHLYGSSRIGIANVDNTLVSSTNATYDFRTNKAQTNYLDPSQTTQNSFTREVGAKNYELVDHLGNVRTVLSDKRLHQELTPNAIEEQNFNSISEIDQNYIAQNAKVELIDGRLKVTSTVQNGGIQFPIKGLKGKTILVRYDIEKDPSLGEVNAQMYDRKTGQVRQYTHHTISTNTAEVDIPFYVYSDDILLRIQQKRTINPSSGVAHYFYLDNLFIEELIEEPGSQIGLNGTWISMPSTAQITETSNTSSKEWAFTGANADAKFLNFTTDQDAYYLVRSKLKTTTANRSFQIRVKETSSSSWIKRQYHAPSLSDYGIALKAKTTQHQFHVISTAGSGVASPYSNTMVMEGTTIHKLKRNGILFQEKFDSFDGWGVDFDPYATVSAAPKMNHFDNRLRVIQSSSHYYAIKKEFEVEAGKYYRFSLDLDFPYFSNSGAKFVMTAHDEFGPYHMNFYSEGGKEMVFKARSSEIRIHIGMEYTGGATCTYLLDNMELVEMNIKPGYVQPIGNSIWNPSNGPTSVTQVAPNGVRVLADVHQGINASLSSHIQKHEYYAIEAQFERHSGNIPRIGYYAYHGAGEKSGVGWWYTDTRLAYGFKSPSNVLDFKWEARDPNVDFTMKNMRLYKLEKGATVGISNFNHLQYTDEIVEYNRPGKIFYKHENSSGNVTHVNDNGKFEVTVSSNWEGVIRHLHTVPGKYYKVSYDLDFIGGANHDFIFYALDSQGRMYNISNVDGSKEILFRAREKLTKLYFDIRYVYGSPKTYSLDNIEVAEMRQVPTTQLYISNAGWVGVSGGNVSISGNNLHVTGTNTNGAKLDLNNLVSQGHYYAIKADMVRNNSHAIGMDLYHQDGHYDHHLGQNTTNAVVFKAQGNMYMILNGRGYPTSQNPSNPVDFNANNIELLELVEDRVLETFDFELEPTPYVGYNNGYGLVYDNTGKKVRVLTGAQWRGIEQSIVTTPGEEYIVEFDLRCSSGNSISAAIASFANQNGSGWWTGIPGAITITQNGHYQYKFTANADHAILVWEKNNAVVSGVTEYFELSNLVVRKASQNLIAETFTTFNGWESYYAQKLELMHPNGMKIFPGTTIWKGVQKKFKVIPGQSYDLTVSIDKGSIVDGNLVYTVKRPTGQNIVTNWISGSGLQTFNNTFTVPAGITEITFRLEKGTNSSNSSATDYFILSNFSLVPSGVEHYYTADVKSYTDYYAFGSTLPGRNYNQNDYKYGYNGMEKDDEVKGSGNSYTTHFRQFDPRIGRWLSIDPKFSAIESPYAGMANNPMYYTDILGDSVKSDKKGNAQVIVNDLNSIYQNKYGVNNAFKVTEVTRKEQVQTNEVELLDPSTWANIFEEDKFKTVESKEYYITTNEEFDWNTEAHTKALFDILNSKDIVTVYFNSSIDHEGKAGGNNIGLDPNLSFFKDVGASKWTYGGVFMHEAIWHKTPLGKAMYESPKYNENTMRGIYGLKKGSVSPLHIGGNFIDKHLSTSEENKRLAKERSKTGKK